MARRVYIFVMAGLLLGCSPEAYRDSADRQVQQILKDRKDQTLGYEPEAVVSTEVAAKPAKKAYEKIPFSPVAPPTTAPIEPAVLGDGPTGPLGPETFWMNPPAEVLEAVDMEVVRRSAMPPPLGPPLPDDMVRRFGLFDCIEYAVQHSRTYQDQMEDLYLAALDVTLERHLFDPRPFVTQGVTYDKEKKGAAYESALKATTTVGVRQKLPYGGDLEARSLVEFVDILSGASENAERASVVLEGSIPLLRGAGMINLEPLIQNERDIVYQVRTFEEFRRSFAVDVASQYFRLLADYNGVMNQRLNVLSLENLTERTRALWASGRQPFLEVQRAMQSLLQAENDLINAEEGYRTTLDNFKLLIGMPIDEPLEIVPIDLDVTIPRATADDAVSLAMRYRLSLRTAADRIDDAQRGVANARNGLLPKLDLEGRFSASNEDGLDDLIAEDRVQDYSLGVTLDLPIDRVAERNAYRRALIAFHRAERSYDAQKDRISVTVRDTLRSIRRAELSVEIQRRNIDLAERRLDNANEQLRFGRMGNRDVIEALNALLRAQDQYAQARSQLQVRVLEFMRDTGTLRIDPEAGALGKALDREKLRSTQAGERQ